MCRQLRVGVIAATCVISVGSTAWSQEKVTVVQVIQPPVRNIVRRLTRLSAIESYERASIQPKLTGYVEKWNVDIGDKVRKGDIVASLFVPELLEDLATKRAAAELAKEQVALARELVTGAEAGLDVAQARVAEARSTLAKYQADVDRWSSEVTRLRREVQRHVVEPAVLADSEARLKSSTAALDTAKAAIATAETETRPKQAAVKKAALDVRVAQAKLAMANSEVKRLQAWNSYLRLAAPFDGVVVARNVNTFDLVQHAAGAAPIYLIDRTDIVRIFFDVPERDAGYVHRGTKASVLVPAFRAEPIPAAVVRTSWALNGRDRTLRAEIDLPNPNSQILPGMYAEAELTIELAGVHTVPRGAVDRISNKAFCWMCVNGRAVRAQIETGASDSEWIEVTKWCPASEPRRPGEFAWSPIRGTEQIILGDRSRLSDGAAIKVNVVTSEAEILGAADVARSARTPKLSDQHGSSGIERLAPGDHGRGSTLSGSETLEEIEFDLAAQRVKVAEAGLTAAEAHETGAKLDLVKQEALVKRWDGEVTRLRHEIDRASVDPGIVDEATNQLRVVTAARDCAKAAIASAAADVQLIKAKLTMARFQLKRAEAMARAQAAKSR